MHALRRTQLRVDVLTAYYVTARRFGIRDVYARAERLRRQLKIGEAFMCTCVMTPRSRKLYDELCIDVQGRKRRFRTVF